jgi:hypothetical protein
MRWCSTRALLISSLSFLAVCLVMSCAAPKQVVKVPVEPLPGLATKVYSADDYDWAGKNCYTLELRETGRTDTVSNQILEKYLANQVVKCLCRKGWVRVEDSSHVIARVFFGVREKSETSSSTLVYGSSLASSSYLTGYGLVGGLIWNASQLAATVWSVSKTDRQVTFYEGSISIEFAERGSNKQIWRGDARLRLGNDDIRLASGLMIRELLWQLPSYDYPPVRVPALSEEEFEGFWRSWVVDREFYAPGRQFPMTVDYGHAEAPRTLRQGASRDSTAPDVLREAVIEFTHSDAYKRARGRSNQWSEFDRSADFWRAFDAWGVEVWNPRESGECYRPVVRVGVAAADILMHAPWSIRNDDGSLVEAGRYLIGEDTTESLVAIVAKPIVTSYLDGQSVRYAYQRYYVTKVEVIQPEDFKQKWREGVEQRQMVLGRAFDFVPPEPLASPVVD